MRLVLATATLAASFAGPGCAGGSAEADAVQALVRASMSIRGVRPSLAELDAVEADPGAVRAIARGWLADPRFGETIRDLHAEQFLVRFDTRDHLEPIGPLADVPAADIVASLDEESLRLVEWVVTEGRPYSEIVTTDVALADPITSAAHGPPVDPADPGWQVSAWPDGRPAAGILSSTSLWQRHMSSNVNLHRTRANFVLSELLCQPFPAGTVISRPGGVDTDAISADPGCVGCHATLDPLASAFFGFRDYVLPNENARAERDGCPPEAAWACTPLGFWDDGLLDDRTAEGMPPPALFGEPVADLAELGRAIAARPEFDACTARRFAAWFRQVHPSEVPEADVRHLVDVLHGAGGDVRVLVLELALERGGQPRRVRPEQLARMIEDLTGFRWTRAVDDWGEVDLLTTDAYGMRLLAGGVNGWDAVDPVYAPTASRELVLERVAAHAADRAVEAGGWPPGGVVTRPHEVRQALAAVWRRVTGERDPAHLDALQALFDDALARSGDPEHAWKVVLTAVLLDPSAERY